LLFEALATQTACLVTVQSTRGSVPRESGTWMAVLADQVIGTIGGGQLEFDALAAARRDLSQASIPALPVSPHIERFALGPSLGQCCGGEVHLQFECVTARDIEALKLRLAVAHQPVALFGAGHVGHALIHLLCTLPVQVTWIDSRGEVFPSAVPANVVCEHSEPVHRAVAQLAARSQVLIMSFSHAEDLDVVAACLTRQRERADLPFIGLIGSHTKWAKFQRRLLARGFTPLEVAGVTCPIGIQGLGGAHAKDPAVIAVAVAAQLLQGFSARPIANADADGKSNLQLATA
jgi:xanthine dehydrogenase accessory factor